MDSGGASDGTAARARAWRDSRYAAVADVHEPWEHGSVIRATRYPGYHDFNVVRVEREPGMSVEELPAFADGALEGLAHRRIDFDAVAAGEARRPGFEARGWNATRLLWMLHRAPPPPGLDVSVERVAYDDVHDLRAAWLRANFPDQDFAAYFPDARAIALARSTQILAVREDGTPIAFAQIERDADSAEIAEVYVHPDHRGRGRGTTLTCAAIDAAADASDLWIVADDDDRPKHLYARLGFHAAWTTMEFLRLPRPAQPSP